MASIPIGVSIQHLSKKIYSDKRLAPAAYHNDHRRQFIDEDAPTDGFGESRTKRCWMSTDAKKTGLLGVVTARTMKPAMSRCKDNGARSTWTGLSMLKVERSCTILTCHKVPGPKIQATGFIMEKYSWTKTIVLSNHGRA